MKKSTAALLLLVFWTFAYSQSDEPADNEKRYESYLKFNSLVKTPYIRPHWFSDGDRFWFAEDKNGTNTIYEVNPRLNSKKEFFETLRLREAVGSVVGHEPVNKGVPFKEFEFVGKDSIAFMTEGQKFRLHLRDYGISSASASKPEPIA
ncbi:hypothetical protein HUK80_02910 [Flavobacterium sp. MAH-1]|uniref:S9 family peptidase n=1 Tax=Flavobacterium agri TaxID=2743471 RepID=A0A7Y9C642_9FLAO|nr:hypothetical protein [Flavobacterium agri]NUY79832.1 hypothetical protein [Flavobacterium agri]NYA69857.1 hypothetical protein [Flavobacterium agri]